jgi:hypothetical protein
MTSSAPFEPLMSTVIPETSTGHTIYYSILAQALARQHLQYSEYYEANFRKHGKFVEAFEELEERKVSIILLCASLVEALANAYLSLKLETEQFNLLEMQNPVEKWVTAPTFFLPNYSLPKGGDLYQGLKTLFARRNGITHMKPEVRKNGKLVHKGNHPRAEYEHDQIRLWYSLPSSLLQHLSKFDTSNELHMIACSLDHGLWRGSLRRRSSS